MRCNIYWVFVLIMWSLSGAAAGSPGTVKAELDTLAAKIGRSNIEIALPQAGDYTLSAGESVTVENLRNVRIDDTPPEYAEGLPTYCVMGTTPNPTTGICVNDYTDGYPRTEGLPTYPKGAAPYVAPGILPFAFDYFNHTLDDSGFGSHNANMHDYAVRHGFKVVNPFNWRSVSVAEVTHYPPDTTQLRSLYSFHWNNASGVNGWMTKLGYGDGNFHKLPSVNVLADRLKAAIDTEKDLPSTQPPEVKKRDPFRYYPGVTQLMIDMEHPYLRSTRITGNDCASIQVVCVQELADYPTTGTPEQQLAFETQYYTGYANTYIAAAMVARWTGWPIVGVYGNDPGILSFRQLSGSYDVLDDTNPFLAWNFVWNNFSRAIQENTDLSHPSIYWDYWDPRNIAYTLANIDLNVKRIRSLVQPKPVRPYLWARIEGFGTDWQWWRYQPMIDEDARAMTALAHFTGVDGVVFWDTTPVSNDIYHPPVLTVGTDAIVGTPVNAEPIAEMRGGSSYYFKRYDVLHVLAREVDAANITWITFQVIDKNLPKPFGVDQVLPPTGPTHPTYKVDLPTLNNNLLPVIGNFPSVFEGLALARAFEYFLRYGEVKIDVKAQQQFKDVSPVVRRVKMGSYHLLATYDPTWQQAGYTPRNVTLVDFDGNPGLNLNLLADSQTRFYAVEIPSADVGLTMTATPEPLLFNDKLTYTVTIRNNGPSVARAVIVTDLLPAGLSWISTTASQGACTGSTTITCNLGNLTNPGSATVTIVARATTAGSKINTVTVSKTEPDPNPANNAASITTNVLPSCSTGRYKIAGAVRKGSSSGLRIAGVVMRLNGSSCGNAITTTNNDYAFTSLNKGTYTITPNKPGCTFTPASRSVVINKESVSGWNKTGFTGTGVSCSVN